MKPKVNKDEALGNYLLAVTEKTKADSRQIAEVVKTLAKFARESWEKVERFLSETEQRVDKKLSEVRDGKDGKDGLDGKNIQGARGDKGERGERGEKGAKGETFIALRGEKGTPGKDGAPDTAEQIKEKIQSLQEDERWDIEDVNGLKNELKKAKSNGLFAGSVRGDVWATGDGSTLHKLSVSTTQPYNPAVNDLWVDIS